jgi:hypothetical protein
MPPNGDGLALTVSAERWRVGAIKQGFALKEVTSGETAGQHWRRADRRQPLTR